MEHDVTDSDVSEVHDRPAEILRHRWPSVDHDLGEENEDRMDEPGAWRAKGLGVSIRRGVKNVLQMATAGVRGLDRRL